MLVQQSRCLTRPLLPLTPRHRHSRPVGSRRHRGVRWSVTPVAYVPEAYTVAATAIPDAQPLAFFVASGLSLALLIGLGLSPQLQGRGNVVTIPPSKLKANVENKNAVLLDIRSRPSIKEFGNPDFKGISIRQKSSPFLKSTKDGDIPDPKFGETFAKTKGLKSDSIVVLMDADGKSAAQAARAILNFNDLKEVYVISGGATALKASGWQWREPTEALSLSLPKVSVSLPKVSMSLPKVSTSLPKVSVSLPKVSMKGLDLDKVAETYKERPTLFNTGLAISALATAGVVLFNEFDIILEMVGLLGGTNVFFKRFFYAEDRKKTIRDLRSLFDDKIVAGEAGDDLKRLAATILESAPASMEEEPPAPPIIEDTDAVTDQVVDTV